MKTVYRNFCKWEEYLCCTMFFSMVVLVLCSAIARLINHPLAWSIDVAQLLLAWTCFIGADVAFRRDKLVGLDLFTRRLPQKVAQIISLVIRVIMFGALVIFIVYGVRLSIESWKRSFQTLTISYSFVTLSLPVASFLMSITAIIKIVDSVKMILDIAE
ncbi:TRAP transporter small permease [Enterocloster clostridioformis]|uniref:TRAP-type C4-dicarboxylate transport system, small permease component n=1 Tax=Enterocloster clostridioformis TaxID=1531 RepID=A0A1I0JFQ4_9FIRM|nr:TRAP transporter small permease [Enterocloster clostridioformis]SEU08109.1 TRAP-type C4-dicarboxylate transport system, small permease component [Enterocloster clostridioformis]SEW45379.1 TRAP-type C4-dicarboxylate transport system, small permease component [Enterocloster clostridioformis]